MAMVDDPQAEKKESRTEFLLSELENQIGSLGGKLGKVMKTLSPEKAEEKSPAEQTDLNERLVNIRNTINELSRRIDL